MIALNLESVIHLNLAEFLKIVAANPDANLEHTSTG